MFSIVGYPSDVESVILDPSTGVLAAAASHKPKYIVDMTTSSPALARSIHDACSRVHVKAVDAPVSGGDIGAREARLSIVL